MANYTLVAEKIGAFNTLLEHKDTETVGTDTITHTKTVDTTDSVLIDCSKAVDERLIIKIQNLTKDDSTTSPATVGYDIPITISKGDGFQAVEDLEITIDKNKTFFIQLESAKFKFLKGSDKGKIKLTVNKPSGSTTVTGGIKVSVLSAI